MKLILKVILLSRPKEQGFVLPVIIALGLIMTLLGTISIFQSSDEQLTASSQRATAKALAAAEIGVNNYRELIDSNKIIATYPACETGTWTNANCDDTSGNTSWEQASNINNINASCLSNSDTTIAAAATRAWQNITAGSPEDGQYRLINYTYIPNYDDNGTPADITDDTYTSPPIGRLTVEGRVNQSNTNLGRDPQAAVARVEVDLPIQPGIPTPSGERIILEGNFNHLHPALWITGDAEGVTNNSGLTVNGNIVVTDTDDCVQDNTGSTARMTTSNLSNGSTQSIILTPIQPPMKTFVSFGADLDNDSAVEAIEIDATEINSGITLPRPGDESDHQDDDSDGIVDPGEEVYYHYRVNGDINLDNESIKIRAQRKVILYLVDGDITFKADGASSRVNLNTDSTDINNPSSTKRSYALEIYGGSSTTDITFKGDDGEINIKALIHAPDAKVTIEDDPRVEVKGAIWVQDWEGISLTTTVSINPDSADADEITRQYYNYTYIRDDLAGATPTPRVVDPVISVPSRWETQQAE